MVLADKSIVAAMKSKDITISPFDRSQLQPCSYDVRLGTTFLIFDDVKTPVIDPEVDNKDKMRKILVKKGEQFILHPNQFALAHTFEEVGVSDKYVCILNGKSSLGRLGLLIHATAGFIDPGNRLHVTLEMFNVAPMPIILRPGMKIGQVVFEALTETCERPYGSPGLNSKYYRSKGVEASKMYRNYGK